MTVETAEAIRQTDHPTAPKFARVGRPTPVRNDGWPNEQAAELPMRRREAARGSTGAAVEPVLGTADV